MPASPYFVSRLRIALGTFVAVEAEASALEVAHRGLGAAFDSISIIEKLMHPNRVGSDLRALADACPGTCVVVHPWTFELIALCQDLHAASRGLFDPCLGAAPGTIQDLDLAGRDRVTVRQRTKIDLGGIAKGYAVDRAIEGLKSSGCTGGLVNAGGDLAVFGDRRHKIVCRAAHGAVALIEIHNAALATSEVEADSSPSEHAGYYRGSDRKVVSSGRVTTLAPKAALADALTKCLLAADRAQSESLLARFGARELSECEPQS